MSGIIGESRAATGKSVEWYTPGWILDELGLVYDLDPASPHDHETAVPAEKKYTIFDDGLKKPWFGRVFMNPPYGRDTGFWVRRFLDHGNGIALVFSRTDARWFQEGMRKANAVLFMEGRIDFIPGWENKHKVSRSGAGTALFACGAVCTNALERIRDRGVFFRIDPEK